jgi:hypothetical protein
MNEYGFKRELEESSVEKDVGVLISDHLKWEKQVRSAAGKANSKLAILDNTFTYKDKNLMKVLYCTYVSPHPEFAVQSWCPYLIKDIKELENVQRRATKMVPEIRHLSYEDRLTALDLSTLEERRLRGDLIQQFKLFKGYDSVNLSNAQAINSQSIEGPASGIRGHKHRLLAEKISFQIELHLRGTTYQTL